MRLGGSAAYMLEVTSRIDLETALAWAEDQKVPVIMVGGGSNIIWKDEGFPGLLIVNKIMRYEVMNEDDLNYYITAGSGELWDSVVARSVSADLTGIESLSLIPGTAGATPVQNVGAYGQEIAQTLVSVEAYDISEHRFVNVPASDCGFGYRTSRFKTTDKGRYFITALTLHLLRSSPQPPFYSSLHQYFIDHKITAITPQTMRDAVIDIRTHKLPDPANVANVGSFFANPVVDEATFSQLNNRFTEVPHWQVANGVKLAAAWLIEQSGFKDFHDPETGMATWPTQPLVFINEHARSTADLLQFRQKIVDAVQTKFNIALVQEPELLP